MGGDVKHKHCEVIKAWADGKTVQWWDDEDRTWNDTSCPTWEGLTYRVKPETVRYRVAAFKGSKGTVWTGSVETPGLEKETSKHPFFVRWLTDWQEVEV